MVLQRETAAVGTSVTSKNSLLLSHHDVTYNHQDVIEMSLTEAVLQSWCCRLRLRPFPLPATTEHHQGGQKPGADAKFLRAGADLSVRGARGADGADRPRPPGERLPRLR